MRTLVDIEEDNLRRLDRLARARRKSRAALIREAVADFLKDDDAAVADAAFGLWQSDEDGLAYQERMRREW